MPAALESNSKVDTAVFVSRLYRKYHVALIRFLKRQKIDDAQAEDIAQEAYYRVCRLNNTGDIKYPRAFLYKTATNLLNDQRRSDERRHVHLHVAMHEIASLEGGFTPQKVLEDRDRLQRFEDALMKLSPQCRKVFILHRFDGLTYSEIAKNLGISQSGVTKHMIKAISQIAEALSEE